MRRGCVRAQSVEDRNHKVRIALGNGLRMDIWAKFQQRFGINRVGEIYAATEGNSALLNTHNRVGVVGRASPFLVNNTLSLFASYSQLTLRQIKTLFLIT